MSHKAVNWALEQRHLKPAAWVVLIKLGDRHNKDTRLVFPDQHLLAEDCNVSRASLNRHLSDLEAVGLIFRVQRVNPATRKQLTTYYILQPDFENPPNIEHAVDDYRAALPVGQNRNTEAGHVSNCDTVAVSQKTPIPCLNSGDSRVSNCDTLNPVKEPKVNPSAPARERGSDFNEFWKVCAKPRDEANCRKLFDAAVASGADGAQIVLAAQAYAGEFAGGAHRYAIGANDWLSGRRWEKGSNADGDKLAKPADPAAFYAAWLNSGRPFFSSAVSPALAREMLGRRLVTSEQLRAAGIAA